MFIFRNEDYTKDIKGTMRNLFNFLHLGKYMYIEPQREKTNNVDSDHV